MTNLFIFSQEISECARGVSLLLTNIHNNINLLHRHTSVTTHLLTDKSLLHEWTTSSVIAEPGRGCATDICDMRTQCLVAADVKWKLVWIAATMWHYCLTCRLVTEADVSATCLWRVLRPWHVYTHTRWTRKHTYLFTFVTSKNYIGTFATATTIYSTRNNLIWFTLTYRESRLFQLSKHFDEARWRSCVELTTHKGNIARS